MKPHIWMFLVVPQKRFDCCVFFLCEEIATVRVTRKVPRWKIWMWKLRKSAVHTYLILFVYLSADWNELRPFHLLPRARSTSLWLSGCWKTVPTSIPAATDIAAVGWLGCRAKWHLYRTNLLKPGVAWKKWPKQATVVAMTPAAQDCPTGEDVWSDYWESCALDRGPFSMSKHHQSFPELIWMWLNGSTFTKQKHPQSSQSISPGRWNERRCLPVSRGGLLATWT